MRQVALSILRRCGAHGPLVNRLNLFPDLPDLYEKLVATSKRNLSPIVRPNDAGGWVRLGFLNLERGNKNAAREAFQTALQYVPQGGASVVNSLARGLTEVGCWSEAARAAQCSIAIKADPNISMLLGDCLFNSARDGFLSAERPYRDALAGGNAAAQRGVGECLARKRDFDAARDAHDGFWRSWLESSESASMRERQANARKRGVPPIVLIAMQKSASEYIRENLMTVLDVPEIAVSIGTIPDDRAVPSALNQLALGGALCRSHMSGNNAAAIAEAGLQRLLLHVRDPRQVTVSWAHMMARISDHEFCYSAHMYDPPVANEYRHWPSDKQLAWAVEHYLPGQLTWLNGWVEAQDRGLGIQICVSTFEEFRRDQIAFFDNLVGYFDLPGVDASAFGVKNDASMRNFRRGEVGEWEELLTAEQKQSIKARLAPLAERFGWPV